MPSLFGFINDMVKSKRSSEDEEAASAPPISLINWPDLGVPAAPAAAQPAGDVLAGATGSATLRGGSGDDDLSGPATGDREEKRFPSPSAAQENELAKARHDAWQSGDPERIKGADNAISHYSDKVQDRIREAAERMVERGPNGEVILTLPPRPEDAGPIDPKTLTGEQVYDALHIPRDSAAFAKDDWKKQMEGTLEALAELEKTDRDKAAKIWQEVRTLHEERDDWHARWDYIKSVLPAKVRDGFLRDASRYRQMSSEERNDFARRFRPYQQQDPEFFDTVWSAIRHEAIGEEIMAGPKFLTMKELAERIKNRKDLQDTMEKILGPSGMSDKPPSPYALLAALLAAGVYISAWKSGKNAQSDLDRRQNYRAHGADGSRTPSGEKPRPPMIDDYSDR